MQKRVVNIIKELAKEMNLPEDVIKAIVDSQFQCARETTKLGKSGQPETFKNIRFKHLGILIAKPYRILHHGCSDD